VPPDTPPFARWTVLLAVLTGLLAAVLTFFAVPGATSAEGPSTDGWTNSPSGPVGPDDRAMLVAVRQAALWEVPAGQQAQQIASRAEVRTTAARMVGDLRGLSDQVRGVAGQLGVLLPNQPTGQQEVWSSEVSGQSGANYDRAFVSHLHTSCLATLAVINRARSDTRNSAIRALANRAAEVVDQHVRYLDGTGLVSAP
jgi:predicted outer membrane protein